MKNLFLFFALLNFFLLTELHAKPTKVKDDPHANVRVTVADMPCELGLLPSPSGGSISLSPTDGWVPVPPGVYSYEVFRAYKTCDSGTITLEKGQSYAAVCAEVGCQFN